MVTYKVTTEINTSWWKRIFRFFNLFAPRKEFEVTTSLTTIRDVFYAGKFGIVKVISAKNK